MQEKSKIPLTKISFPYTGESSCFSGSTVSWEGFATGGFDGAYLDFSRSVGPYFMSANGMGIMAMAMKPMSEDAHRGFRASYIWVAKS